MRPATPARAGTHRVSRCRGRRAPPSTLRSPISRGWYESRGTPTGFDTASPSRLCELGVERTLPAGHTTEVTDCARLARTAISRGRCENVFVNKRRDVLRAPSPGAQLARAPPVRSAPKPSGSERFHRRHTPRFPSARHRQRLVSPSTKFSPLGLAARRRGYAPPRATSLRCARPCHSLSSPPLARNAIACLSDASYHTQRVESRRRSPALPPLARTFCPAGLYASYCGGASRPPQPRRPAKAAAASRSFFRGLPLPHVCARCRPLHAGHPPLGRGIPGTRACGGPPPTPTTARSVGSASGRGMRRLPPPSGRACPRASCSLISSSVDRGGASAGALASA